MPCTGPAGGVLTGTFPNPGLADNVVDLAKLTDEAKPALNILSNPGFDFAQLHDPTAYATLSDNDVAADCWRCTFENSAVQYKRIANVGVFQSANRGSFKKTGSAGKIMVYQPWENLLSLGFMNHAITFNFGLNFGVSTSNKLHVALLQYNGATPDILTPPVSAWNANGTSPTLAANWSYIFDFTIDGGAGSPLPAGFYNFFADYGNLPVTGFTNFAIALFTDSQLAINDLFELAECGVYEGFGGRFVWNPLTPNENTARVERFIEKTYDPDVLAGTVTNIGQVATTQASNKHVEPIRFKQRKPKTPKVTLYNPNGAASEPTWDDTDAISNVPINAEDVGTGGFSAAVALGGANGNKLVGHYLADASL